ncbi:MAG: hypothetical protein A3A97_04570 [Candidatus Terrybacteria bacterium RIFCSPLOWO2_01_FULL_40_23]|uniref:CR-type domain-containing protein n=1 Tax=Candidatus Terrybacteria bacterium RIFCSPLOWO2_01_FULL_40_23 TaxID=1802366 RepID=A0A1G2PUZ9_9BACT|nr:MAG: hypothetical protein A3A97_04570 [Candidatus Terrybacteria bacterium RIFCSPLOWO2_01_FULL_40_23]
MHFLNFHAFVPVERKERQTLKLYFAIIFAAGILFFSTAYAITNCDEQAKPAFDCPVGYTMMCIPVGGDHWGCGKEVNGQMVEWTSDSQVSDNTAVPVFEQQTPPVPPESPVTNTATPPANTQEQTSPQPQTVTEEPPSPIEVITETSPLEQNSVSDIPVNTLISKAPYVVAAVAVFVFFWLGWRQWRKWKKRSVLPPVGGAVEKTVCGTCGGSGKVKRKRMKSVPCGHCKQTGRDICHHCGGTGRYGVGLTVPQTEEEVQSMMKCDYCKGSGFPKIAIACCMCKGKKKEEYEEIYEVPCPDCRGTGYR